ncbi:MAG: tetratricopeptide repeat protein [Gammaproteobacteria bacterium]|nr:tetratricopeptide repeat protein [Gammaproteobacteria bacterium]
MSPSHPAGIDVSGVDVSGFDTPEINTPEIDTLAIDKGLAMSVLPVWVLLATLVLGGCAGTRSTLDAAPPAQVDRASPAPAAQAPQVEQPPRLELTEEILYKLLVAEFAGQRGQVELALDSYLDLARRVPDARIAERATGIAVFAKRNAEAREAAELWVQRAPTDLEARQVLAALLIRGGEVDEALHHLELVMSASKEGTGQGLKMIASFLGNEGDKRAALEVMRRLVAAHQDDPDALFAYALLAIKTDQLPAARQAMEQILSRGAPTTPMAMTYVGIRQKQGDTEGALSWLEGQIEKNPQDFDLRTAYARLLADRRRFDDAKEQFEILAKMQPDNAEVRFALGILHLQTQSLESAEGNFRRLVNGEEYADEASFYLGQLAETRKDYDQALKWYSSVGEGDNHFDAQLSMALTMMKQKRFPAAREQLHGIAPATPDQKTRLTRVEGELLSQEGKYREAMDVYDRALEGGFNGDLLYSRAMLAEKMGRLDLLERDLKLILEREPDNSQALNALGYSLADQTTRYPEAYALIKRAYELSPNDYYVLDSLGWVLYRMGRLDEAEGYLRRALKLRNDPEVAAHLGEVLWFRGDRKGARMVWEDALQSAPGDRKVLDAMQRLSP